MSWGSPDVFYDPEKFGLTSVETIDFSDGSYQFDYLAVWKDGDGNLYYAEDSGCSCPSPFDGMGLPDLTRVQDAMEIVSRMEYRLSEMGDWYSGEKRRVEAEIADFKSKIKRGDL